MNVNMWMKRGLAVVSHAQNRVVYEQNFGQKHQDHAEHIHTTSCSLKLTSWQTQSRRGLRSHFFWSYGSGWARERKRTSVVEEYIQSKLLMSKLLVYDVNSLPSHESVSWRNASTYTWVQSSQGHVGVVSFYHAPCPDSNSDREHQISVEMENN